MKKNLHLYKLTFDCHMPDVRSLSLMAYDVEDAIYRSKLILGKHEVSDTLNSVELVLPF